MYQELESYLERVERRLRPLAASERADIVREIHSEMGELEARGLTPQEITARLGDPRELAAAYLGEAITKNPRFSWRRLGALAAFYTLAGLSGMIVLPATGITAAVFLLCGALLPAAALLSLLASLVGLETPWVVMQLGGWTAPPALAFPIAAVIGVLLLLAGRGLWKLTVRFVQAAGQKRRSLHPFS